ncbi:MAG: hypothetical protein H6812_10685 [Phycisphaeraceae bacterium]|nr:hypothetical protein [Phycisphaerales bacterium]MCB9843712.1 hypothetical protein [Phycisphaeraceae bacterium]
MSENRPDRRKRGWFAPEYPGHGKCPFTGFLCGFVFGALGASVFLRSIADGLAVLVVGLICAFMYGIESALFIPVFCGLWCAARVVWDTSRRERGAGVSGERARNEHATAASAVAVQNAQRTLQHPAHGPRPAHN